MILRIALIALIACGLAGFGAVAWMVVPGAEPAAAAPQAALAVPKRKVVVAARAIAQSALLTADDVTMGEVAETELPAGPMADEPAARKHLVGAMIRRALVPGEPVSTQDVLRPADHGFLAAVLRPGTRAVTVTVDSVSGAAGLVWPGDRVDLILTQQLDGTSQAPGRRVAAETVQRDLRVIAIDPGPTPGGADPAPARIVTLEVSSARAEQVQVAARLGRLSLAVRAADRGDGTETGGTTWAADVSSALGTAPPRPAASTMRVYGGSQDSKEYRF